MKLEDVVVKVQSKGKLGERIAISMAYKDKVVFAEVSQKEHNKAIEYLFEKLKRMTDEEKSNN